VLFGDSIVNCDFTHPIALPQRPPRHGHGVNVTFADGHAKFLKSRRSATGNWVIDGGPYDGAEEFDGIVRDDGSVVIQWQ
jgi:prepilin-type processing-associated H-X9-DG protein